MFDRLKEEINSIKARDPAVRSALEVIFLYPSFKAMRSYRRAHWSTNTGISSLPGGYPRAAATEPALRYTPALRSARVCLSTTARA